MDHNGNREDDSVTDPHVATREQIEIREWLEGLSVFLERYRRHLEEIWNDVKNRSRKQFCPKPIVLLNMNGPTMIDFPRLPRKGKATTGIDKFLMSSVYPTSFLFGKETDWESFNRVLADHLFYLRLQSTTFFQTMYLLDPVADGDCGFIVLQLFSFFVQEKTRSLTEMRKFLVAALRDDLNYFKSSEILIAMQREPEMTDEQWEIGKEISAGTLALDMNDEDSEESLFDIVNKDTEGNYPMMDCRHLEVYAKETKTRIVLLFYWRSSKKFSCLDIDWRETAAAKPANSSTPEVKYSVGLPDFGNDYDFFRTAVIMNAPTIERVNGDNIVWKGEQRHFSMWLPTGYDPLKETPKQQRAAENKRVPHILGSPPASPPMVRTATTTATLVPAIGGPAGRIPTRTGLNVTLGTVEEYEIVEHTATIPPVCTAVSITNTCLGDHIATTNTRLGANLSNTGFEHTTGSTHTTMPTIGGIITTTTVSDNGIRSNFGINSLKAKMKRQERIKLIPTPVPGDVLKFYANLHQEEEDQSRLHMSGITFRPLDGIKKGAAICLICGNEISTDTKKPFFRGEGNQNWILPVFTGNSPTQRQRAYIDEHVQKKHPTMPFALMVEWKNIQEKEVADMKALIQEALFSAYTTGGGINLGIFGDLNETRSDTKLKLRLCFIFGSAHSYVKTTLLNNLKKRAYMMNWLNGEEPCSKDQKIEARNRVDAKIVETGAKWIEMMDRYFAAFDFVNFLVRHEGNWRCMWNSMVYFFRRGLYFEDPYPPMRNSMSMIDSENFNVVETLDKVLNEVFHESSREAKTSKKQRRR